MTWSAPRERNMSSFLVLSMAATSAPNPCHSEKMQRIEPPGWDGGGFLISHVGRFCFYHSVLGQTDVLSIRAKTKTGSRKDLVAFLTPSYLRPDGLNLS